MQCPRCQSQNVVLCSMAYEQGTVTATTKTKGSTVTHGTASGADGSFAWGQAQHTHHGEQTTVSRTGFAERAAPPENPVWTPAKIVGCLIVFLIAITFFNGIVPGIFTSVLGTSGFSGPGFRGLAHLTMWIIAASAVWLFFSFTKLPAYRARLARWRKLWIYAACGKQFVSES